MYQTRIRNGKKKAPKHRILDEPDEGQKYGIVQELLGSGRVKVLCEDSQVRMGRIRGAMRKYGNKVLIERGDLVIVALREFEDDKLDVVHKYNYDECTLLTREGILPPTIQRAWMCSMGVTGTGEQDGSEEYVVFSHEDV